MIERYTLPRMKVLWSEENKLSQWLKVELLACEAQAQLGNLPSRALEKIKKNARFDLNRVKEIEKETKHDLVAFLQNLAENVGEESKYIHYGLTSYDVEDTALSLLLKQAGEIILEDLEHLSSVIKGKALLYKYTPIIGRTHGVHAEPTTWGLKMALWYEEIQRNISRMKSAVESVAVGKLSGAVGNFAHIDPQVEEYVCKKLNLKPAKVSTQILQRDRHAFYLSVLAIIASSIEKFALEIRNLQRTEILEVEESFGNGQKGSSAMPHKRNPMTCERLCGLSRLIRGNLMAALENVVLWHERDITHSSVERIILPDTTTIVDYMLVTAKDILEGLIVYPENMLKNINLTGGVIFSQRVLLRLTEKAPTREEAYEIVQSLAMQSWDKKKDFSALLKKDKRVQKYLTVEEIDSCFDIGFYTKKVDIIFQRVFG